jgi:hypothetical protein
MVLGWAMERGIRTSLPEGCLTTSARKHLLFALSRAGLASWLLFLSACGPAGSAGSTSGGQSQASAGTADVTLVKAVALITDPGNGDFIHAESVTAATVLPEGGFLALTNARGGGSFAYKISNLGAVLWRKELPQGTVAKSAGISKDGSYWIAGGLSEVADQKILVGVMDYAARIDGDGTVSPPVVLSSGQSIAHREVLSLMPPTPPHLTL